MPGPDSAAPQSLIRTPGSARIMEALFQIVGCVLSSKSAPRRIDEFVAQVRRERAVVTVKDTRGATFVRFNAPDARLLTLACEAVLSKLPSSLRFGFASGSKEALPDGQDGPSISHRIIAQATDLAAGARDGEVLVSPQLASLLIGSGLTFHSKDVHLPGGRIVPARLLDLTHALAQAHKPDDRPDVQSKVGDALVRVYQTLMSHAGEMARKQADLEARLDAALSRTTPAEDADGAATRPGELDAQSDAQHQRMQEQQQSIDLLEERINKLHQSAADAERKLADVLAQHGQIESRSRADLQFVTEHRDGLTDLRAKIEDLLARAGDAHGKIEVIESRRQTVEEVQSRANAITHMLADINLNLEMLSEQRAVVDHVGEQLARLDFTVQEAQNTLRALQREREVAERVEQGIKALRNRGGTNKLSQ